MSDQVDAAVQAAARPIVRMRRLPVTMSSTGRPAVVEIPEDMTDGELVELGGWLLTQVAVAVRNERAKKAQGRILIPVGVARS